MKTLANAGKFLISGFRSADGWMNYQGNLLFLLENSQLDCLKVRKLKCLPKFG